MAESDFVLVGHERTQVKLDLVGVGLARQSQALCQPADMRVHPDRRLAERIASQDIGGLPAYAREGHEIFECFRNLALEPTYEFAATFLDGLGLVAVKAGAADLRLQRVPVEAGPILWGPVLLKERRRHLIDPLVGALRGQDEGDQEFKGRGEVQRKPCVRVGSIQDPDDLQDPALLVFWCFLVTKFDNGWAHGRDARRSVAPSQEPESKM